MKVYQLENIEYGEYEVLTEKELLEDFTTEQIEMFKSDEMYIFEELPYNMKQLKKARALKSDSDYCWEFEQQNGFAPKTLDILESLYK